MNVEIGAETTLFPEKEYINGIFVAVCAQVLKTHQAHIKLKMYRYISDAFRLDNMHIGTSPLPRTGDVLK
jgi:hypothetical protein